MLNLPSVITYARNALTSGATASTLLNVSTRLEVGLDDHVAISGFIVDGTGTKKVMLRALGPSFSQSGITDLLVDPFLELHDQTGAIIATNDNWETTQLGGVITATQQEAIRASTIPPNDPAEAAIIADLSPGAYTAVVRGSGNRTGLGLAEIYDLSQFTCGGLQSQHAWFCPNWCQCSHRRLYRRGIGLIKRRRASSGPVPRSGGRERRPR